MKYLLFFSLYVNLFDFYRKSAEINKMAIITVPYQLPNMREKKSKYLLFMTIDEGLDDSTEDKVKVVSEFDVDVLAVENVLSVVDIPHWTLTIPPSPPAIDACYFDN